MFDDLLQSAFGFKFLQGKNKNELTFKVNGEEIQVISAKVLRTFDNPSDSVSAVVYWEPTDQKKSELLRLFGYQDIEVFLGGNLVLTGYLSDISNIVTSEGSRKELVGYSYSIDIVDSNMLPPWEIKKVSLRQRAEAIISELFDDKVNVDARAYLDADKPFKKVKIGKTQTVYSHLSDLANQRSIVISNYPDGTVLLTKVNDTDLPISTLSDNKYPGFEYAIKTSARKRHGTYYVFGKTPGRKVPKKKKFKYAWAQDESIPRKRNTIKMINANNTDLTDLQSVADWHRSKQFASAFSITYPVTSWYADNDKLWEPNTLVTVESNYLELANGFDFLIRQVEFNYDENGAHAVLSLVPPQVFTGKVIKDPWKTESDDLFLTSLKDKILG
jgi:prophage tail gpP-like protein